MAQRAASEERARNTGMITNSPCHSLCTCGVRDVWFFIASGSSWLLFARAASGGPSAEVSSATRDGSPPPHTASSAASSRATLTLSCYEAITWHIFHGTVSSSHLERGERAVDVGVRVVVQEPEPRRADLAVPPGATRVGSGRRRRGVSERALERLGGGALAGSRMWHKPT